MKKTTLLSLLLLITSYHPLGAQTQYLWPLDGILKKIKNTELKDISYDYKVVLEDRRAHQRVDSMLGHLIADKKCFIDSNRITFRAKNEHQYCKLDYADKKAIVLDLDDYARQLKMPLINEPISLLNITDELLNTEGVKMEFDLTNKSLFRLKLKMPGNVCPYIEMNFKTTDYSLSSAYFEVYDQEDGEEHIENSPYRRIYQIYNVVHAIPNKQIFDLTRIFTINKGIVQFNKKYAAYKLIKITQ